MDQIKIGKFISEKRKELGITQSELAEKLNITDRAISKWENGVCMPDVGTIPELCEILNITINDLLYLQVKYIAVITSNTKTPVLNIFCQSLPL